MKNPPRKAKRIPKRAAAPKITITDLRDDVNTHGFDFTPDNRRTYARTITLDQTYSQNYRDGNCYYDSYRGGTTCWQNTVDWFQRYGQGVVVRARKRG